MHVIYYITAGNRFHLNLQLIGYRMGDFAVLCAKIGVETIMTDNVGVMSIGTLICDFEANTYLTTKL